VLDLRQSPQAFRVQHGVDALQLEEVSFELLVSPEAKIVCLQFLE